MRRAGGRLLAAAQRDGVILPDVEPVDLFALANALSWVGDQAPVLAERRDHLFRLVLDGLRPRTGPVAPGSATALTPPGSP